jgi:hypothetical protein
MPEFDPDQALARFIELYERQDQECDQLPDMERKVAQGQYEFHASVDHL